MGNQQFTEDKKFMLDYYQKEKDFLAQTPLYDVKNIKFPLSTSGMKIVDATGRRVKLAGVNWSGGHAERHCVGGLDRRPLRDLCKFIKEELDFNVVRLCFSLQMFYDNNVIEKKHIQANPQLYGKTSMQIFDETVRELTDAGIMVYLNNHTSKSQWCCSDNDGDGLWWSKQYSEELFFNCLREMARRYRHNPRVIGIDLRNEIRKANGMNPTWGSGEPLTDWHAAAQKISNDLQDIAPDWLIIVGGLFYQIDLTGVFKYPIRLKRPNKLIYTGHIYGFTWWNWYGPLWNISSYGSFFEKIFNEQLYVRNLGAPFLFGEFGNNNQDIFWNYMMKLLKETDVDWTYWCFDGYKCANQEDQSYGVMHSNFKDIRHPKMLAQLKERARPQRPVNR